MTNKQVESSTDDFDTISIEEAAKMTGMKEKTLVKKILNGEIIAAEYGGRGQKTVYEIFRSSVEEFIKSRKEEKEKKRRSGEEEKALNEGRKIIDIFADEELVSEGFPNRDFRITWKDEMKEYTFEKLFDMLGEQYQIDLSFVKDCDIECEKIVYKLSDKLEKCTFIRVEHSGDVFFICPVGISEKVKKSSKDDKEKKDIKSLQETLDKFKINATVKIDVKEEEEKNVESSLSEKLKEDVDFEDIETVKGIRSIVEWYDDAIFDEMENIKILLSERKKYVNELSEKLKSEPDPFEEEKIFDLEEEALAVINNQEDKRRLVDTCPEGCEWGKKCAACLFMDRRIPDFPILYCGKHGQYLYSKAIEVFISKIFDKEEESEVKSDEEIEGN